MTSSPSCNEIQECMLAGTVLDERAQEHLLVCARCASFAADYLALDSLVIETLGEPVSVPDDFADRVMASLDARAAGGGRLERWLVRRWVQVALAHVGLAVAVVNILRFVLSSLLPSARLGGAP